MAPWAPASSRPWIRSASVSFIRQGIAFEALKPLRLTYRGQELQQTYVADFVCYERIIIELKAVRALAPEHRAQTINYLRASGARVALLVNFGAMSVEIERFAVRGTRSVKSVKSVVRNLEDQFRVGISTGRVS